MGRRASKNWDELAPKVLESVRSGVPLGRTCKDLGLNELTLRAYRKRTPEYDAELTQAIKENPNSRPGFSKNPVRNPEGKGGFPPGVTGNPAGSTSLERDVRERTRHKGLVAKERAIEAMAGLPAVAAKNMARLDAILDRLFDEWERGELDTKVFLAAKDRLQKDMDTLSKFIPKDAFKQEEHSFKDDTSPVTKFLSMPPEERAKALEQVRDHLSEVDRIKSMRDAAMRGEDVRVIDVGAAN